MTSDTCPECEDKLILMDSGSSWAWCRGCEEFYVRSEEVESE